MSPKSEHVERELLAIGFRVYPRGLANGFLFACLTVAMMWPKVPHAFLMIWLAAFAALAALRLSIGRAFLAREQPASSFELWTMRAAAGYAAIGLLWGALGAGAIHFAFEEKIYILWVGFLIVLFTVLQSQSTGAKPVILRSFLVCAVTPIMVVSILETSPMYWLRLLAEALVFGIALLAGGSGNRNARETIAMRYENVELLQELTRQKEELDRANASKSRFLAAASHDLRQPMQALVLLVESLQDRAHEPAVQRIVESIRASVGSMSTLLNEILDISRFDAGTVKPQRASFPVSDILDRLRASFAHAAARKNLQLRVRRSQAVVDSDPVLLYRILSNLVDNALRYTERGAIVVGCRPRGDSIAIQVWDSGVGIAAGDTARIFDEFYQVDNPQRDRTQGLGLGLSIVERSARLLGHELRVRSEVGHGSCFTITVPRGDPALVRAPQREAAGVSLAGTRVLLVEDAPDIRAAMTVLLEGWGCRVFAARTPTEADDLIWQEPAPDAVLADYGLPGNEDGIAYLRRTKTRFPGVPAILITGNIGPEVLREAEAAQLPVLHKPLRPARLRALLGSLVRKREAAAA